MSLIESQIQRIANECRFQTTVTWDGLHFEVSATSAYSIEWIDSHCFISQRPTSGAGTATKPSPLSVVVDVSTDQYSFFERLLRDLEPVGSNIGKDDAAYDIFELEGWDLFVRSDTLDNRHIVARRGQELLVVSAPSSLARRNSLRVIREVLREHWLAARAITLHASASASSDGPALLFVGDSGSGKTTLSVVHGQNGGRILSTDQSGIVRRDGQTVALGKPAVVRLGVGALRALGRFDDLRHERRIRDQPDFADTAVRRQAASYGSKTKLELSQRELGEAFEASIVESLIPDALVVLHHQPQSVPVVLPLAASDLVTALGTNLLPSNADFPTQYLARQQAPVNDDLDRELLRAMDPVPTFLVKWDPTFGPSSSQLLLGMLQSAIQG